MFWQWHAPCTSTMVPTSRPLERIGNTSSVGSLLLESAAVVHAASLSAAAFKSGDTLSCCAKQTATVPLKNTKANKMIDFMGPKNASLYIGLLRQDTTHPRANPLFKQVRGTTTGRHFCPRRPSLTLRP